MEVSLRREVMLYSSVRPNAFPLPVSSGLAEPAGFCGCFLGRPTGLCS